MTCEVHLTEPSVDQVRIGVMGGTFDPIHNGHLLAAEEARCNFNLREVIFVPSGHPPHKDVRRISSPEDRFRMVSLAVGGNRFFRVSRIEMDSPGPHHTVDTIGNLIKQYGPRVSFYFITGIDSVLQIMSWKSPLRLAEVCRLVAVSRPGYNLDRIRDLPEEVRASVRVLEIPLMAISSTDIRNRVREGRSVRYLVPDPVHRYLLERGLYRC
jgi:nicotinate-nucleotide adenylyltransferase